MKSIKLFAVIAAAFLLIAPFQSAKAQSSLNLGNLVSGLTSANGSSAGSALLKLYTQYKSAGKIDLTDPTTITNLLTLANNIKGLNETDSKTDLSSFVSGLISGSKNLVNNGNSSSVLKTLKSISGLDLSSLGDAAASAALSTAKSGLLSKLGGSSNSATSAGAADDSAAKQAGNMLTKLFKTLGK